MEPQDLNLNLSFSHDTFDPGPNADDAFNQTQQTYTTLGDDGYLPSTATSSSSAVPSAGLPIDFLITGIGSTAIAVLGVLGNLLSAIVLSHPEMRSSVTALLLGLTFCDTCLISISIFIFGLPNIAYHTAYRRLRLYHEVYYPQWVPYLFPISITAQTGSVYLTLAVTIERYVAVSHPLKARSFCTWRKGCNWVAGVLLLATAYNLPRWFEIGTVEAGTTMDLGDGTYNVTTYLNEMKPMRNSASYKLIYINWMYFLVMYLVPFVGLAGLNWTIYRQVRKANQELQAMSKSRRRELSLATMLLVVVVVFLLCNALPLVNNVLESFYQIEIANLIQLSNFFVILNSSVNFIIYCTCGERFRRHLVRFCKGRLLNSCNLIKRRRNGEKTRSLYRKAYICRRPPPPEGQDQLQLQQQRRRQLHRLETDEDRDDGLGIHLTGPGARMGTGFSTTSAPNGVVAGGPNSGGNTVKGTRKISSSSSSSSSSNSNGNGNVLRKSDILRINQPVL